MSNSSRDQLLSDSVVEILSTIISFFVAITSIIGSILLMSGAEDTNLSFTLLEGTPFTDFFIPGLLLLLIVGSSSSVSSYTYIRNINNKEYVSLLAGAVLTGWITVEILLLNQPNPTIIEYVYLFLGLVLFFLSLFLILNKKKT